MHDKNGRPLHRGDTVRAKIYEGVIVGVIVRTQPGAVSCNIDLVHSRHGQMIQTLLTAKETELIATRDGEMPEARPIEGQSDAPSA